MWNFFPRLVSIFDSQGVDFISDLLPPFDNYISFGTEKFLNGYHLEIFRIFKTIVTEDRNSEANIGDALKLMEVVFQNCRGRIDSLVEPILEMVVHRFTKAKKTFLKVLLVEMIANSLWYNPILTLQILEKQGCTEYIFENWFQLLPKHHRIHDKKISILALCMLFSLPVDSLPLVIRAGLNKVFEGIIKLTKEIESQKEEQKKKEEEEEKEENDEVNEDYDEELIEDQDQGNSRAVENLLKAAPIFEDEKEDSFDEESSDDSEIESEEESSFPIDEVDELVFFVEYMKDFASKNPTTYQTLWDSLHPGFQSVFQNLAFLAEKRKFENAQQRLEDKQKQ